MTVPACGRTAAPQRPACYRLSRWRRFHLHEGFAHELGCPASKPASPLEAPPAGSGHTGGNSLTGQRKSRSTGPASCRRQWRSQVAPEPSATHRRHGPGTQGTVRPPQQPSPDDQTPLPAPACIPGAGRRQARAHLVRDRRRSHNEDRQRSAACVTLQPRRHVPAARQQAVPRRAPVRTIQPPACHSSAPRGSCRRSSWL